MIKQIGKFKDYCEAHPRRVGLWCGALMVLVAACVVLVWYPVQSWRTYEIKPARVVVELPSVPQPTSARIEVGAAVFEARTTAVAVVVASFHWECESGVQREAAVRHALSYLVGHPDIDGLQYRVARARIEGETAWRVRGRFARNGVLCRLAGLFVSDAERTRHVLCFYSDEKGAGVAERVLRSVQFPRGGAAEAR